MTTSRLSSRALAALCLSLASVVWSGCIVGPRLLPPTRYAFSEALARSWSEQLLLNLVRLRYRDNPLFLEVGSIVSSYTQGVSAGTVASVGGDGKAPWEYESALGIAYSETPTVTYSPLQGQEFTQRLLTPISPNVLVLLSQSGWSVERLFLCCVQRMNGIPNALGASGPTPDYVPSFDPFKKVARLLRELQVRERLRVDAEGEGDLMTLRLRFVLPQDGEDQERVTEIRRLLNLPDERNEFRVVMALAPKKPDEIAITPRSLLSVFFYLSQAVEAPQEHEQSGIVTVTRRADGTEFDWQEMIGGFFRVQSGKNEPTGAAVKVPYRGHWFWIADNDLSSKTTFNLLTFLFSLKAGSEDLKEPLLTLGVR